MRKTLCSIMIASAMLVSSPSYADTDYLTPSVNAGGLYSNYTDFNALPVITPALIKQDVTENLEACSTCHEGVSQPSASTNDPTDHRQYAEALGINAYEILQTVADTIESIQSADNRGFTCRSWFNVDVGVSTA